MPPGNTHGVSSGQHKWQGPPRAPRASVKGSPLCKHTAQGQPGNIPREPDLMLKLDPFQPERQPATVAPRVLPSCPCGCWISVVACWQQRGELRAARSLALAACKAAV